MVSRHALALYRELPLEVDLCHHHPSFENSGYADLIVQGPLYCKVGALRFRRKRVLLWIMRICTTVVYFNRRKRAQEGKNTGYRQASWRITSSISWRTSSALDCRCICCISALCKSSCERRMHSLAWKILSRRSSMRLS